MVFIFFVGAKDIILNNTNNEMMTKIFLFEEQQLFNETLQFFLNSQPNLEVVGSDSDETLLIDNLNITKPDVILFGINKLNTKPYFVINDIRKEFNDLKIIVLNDGLDIKDMRKLFKNGVNGFLEKNSNNAELLNSIESVIEDKIYVDIKIRERLFSEYFDNSSVKNSPTLHQELTMREIEVLKLICEGYNSKEIAEELFISINTVETHRKKIIQKFNVKNSIGIVRYALQNNMI